MQKITKTNEETMKFGAELANRLTGGDILCLEGELGAGKTTLVKGLARGLGITEEVTSPTFSLMNIYAKVPAQGGSSSPAASGKTLIHIDTYRLKNEEELLDIGVEDYLGAPDTICVIEWPEKIEGLLKDKKTLRVKIEHLDGRRKITVKN